MDRTHEELIGNSSSFALALEHVSNLAGINRPVLILGERGTGKELAAERLHFLSSRWDHQLIKVNCAAISEQLLDSELFGHEAGAFTGANRNHHGRFERANGGTLFLDEIATMSVRLQEKLLRVIEYGEFERLGGQETRKVDVRILAATNENLPEKALEGGFREDLLDRLSFDVIHLPPLRSRPEDVEVLARHFAVQMCTELQWNYFAGFTQSAIEQLNQHQWPGNVRELKNVVERSLYRWGNPDSAIDDIILNPFTSPYEELTNTISQHHNHSRSVKTENSNAASSNTDLKNTEKNTISEENTNLDFTQQVKHFERKILQSTLHNNHYHQGRTAKALGLTYHQLRGLLRKYHIKSTQSKPGT